MTTYGKGSIWKRNILMQILCQYMKLCYEIILSFHHYISKLISLKLLEILSSVFFPVNQSTKHFESKRSCFLILKTRPSWERTSENWWSNFFLTNTSLTPVSDIRDRQREIFMAEIDFASITDGDKMPGLSCSLWGT